jgi:hypothetical protein
MNIGVLSFFLPISASLKICWQKEIFQVDTGSGSMCPAKNVVSQFERLRWYAPKQILVCKKNPKLMERCHVHICQSDNNCIEVMTHLRCLGLAYSDLPAPDSLFHLNISGPVDSLIMHPNYFWSLRTSEN